jgi:hypothetical protein
MIFLMLETFYNFVEYVQRRKTFICDFIHVAKQLAQVDFT